MSIKTLLIYEHANGANYITSKDLFPQQS